jgi:hypothetical protein
VDTWTTEWHGIAFDPTRRTIGATGMAGNMDGTMSMTPSTTMNDGIANNGVTGNTAATVNTSVDVTIGAGTMPTAPAAVPAG